MMLKKILLLLSSVLVILIFTSACANNTNSSTAQKNNQAQLVRPAPPDEFSNLTMPNLSQSDLEEGKRLYTVDCTSCHGSKGMGDGPVAASLEPKPQPLALTEASLSDGYLFWRISEGGQQKPFLSAMPAWKTILNEQQIWQIIGYLRELKS
jgi:mono/diheme cytochrome c family protein